MPCPFSTEIIKNVCGVCGSDGSCRIAGRGDLMALIAFARDRGGSEGGTMELVRRAFVRSNLHVVGKGRVEPNLAAIIR